MPTFIFTCNKILTMKNLIGLFVIALILLNVVYSSSGDDVAQLALNYLSKRFGYANYEIVSINKWEEEYYVVASEGKNYYHMVVEKNNVTNLEVRELNMNFELSNKTDAFLIECLNEEKKGFGLEFSKTISMTYYRKNYQIHKDSILTINNISLIEHIGKQRIPAINEIIKEINLIQFKPTVSFLKLSNNKVIAININYEYYLNNSTRLNLIFTVIPSSSYIANLTNNFLIKEYALTVSLFLNNYNKIYENSSLALKIVFNKNIINQEVFKKTFYKNDWLEVFVSSNNEIIGKGNEILLNFDFKNGNSVQEIKIIYRQIKEFTSILYDYTTIFFSIIMIILVVSFMLVRYRKIKKELG